MKYHRNSIVYHAQLRANICTYIVFVFFSYSAIENMLCLLV